jgi:hypothetical protein
MLRRIIAMVRKEFIQVVRDPRTLALVLAMPIMQLMLFGYAINTTVDHIRLVVSDQARTADSRSLVQALVNSTFFMSPDNATQARAAIDRARRASGWSSRPTRAPCAGRSPSQPATAGGRPDPNTAAWPCSAPPTGAGARPNYWPSASSYRGRDSGAPPDRT